MAETSGDQGPTQPPRRHGRVVSRLGLGAAVVLAALQAVPYGWDHSNPPVVRDAPWPDATGARIARTSCYSCHSNETDWPVYSYVAPMSWLVRSDVERGRDELNFSDWDEHADEADDAISMVERGEMPLDRYTWIHRDARLSDDERDVLIRALEQMSNGDGESGHGSDDNSGRGSSD
jgi:hypothetical protein